MKPFRKSAVAIFVSAAMVWSMAFGCADAVRALRTYVPVGLIAFDGAIDIISPVPGSPLQLDKVLVDGAWQSLSTAFNNYDAVPVDQKKTALEKVKAALSAVQGGVSKTLLDFGGSAAADESVKAAIIVISATLAALDARIQPNNPAAVARAAQHVKSVKVKGSTIPVTGDVKQFKSTYNKIMVAGGHADHQLQ